MQLKRILVSFLVAVMMISLAVVAVSAADDAATFGITVDSANAEGNIKVTPGDSIDVDVKITNNPGVGSINFEVVYDATALTLTGYTFNDKAYSLGELGAVFTVADNDNDGDASVFVFTDPDAKENKNADVIITLHFTVAEDFEGEKASVMINPENLEVFTPAGDKITNVETAASCSKGHTPAEAVVENEVAATCAKEGTYDSVVYCSVCEEEISREAKTTEKLEHTPAEAVKENEVAPECEVEGTYDSVVYCSECDAELSREAKTTEATGHTAEFVAATAPTCDKAGLTAGMQCTVCEKFTVEQKEIPALGHSFTKYVANKDATCTANGTETAKCDRCDVTDKRIVADSALGHKAGEVVVENKVEATCSATGSYDNVVYCTDCKEELSRKTVVTDKIAHKVEEAEAKEPTCSEPGFTSGGVCTVCGEIIAAADYIAPLEHTPVAIPAVEATCTSIGLTEGSKCSVCNTVLKAQEIVPVKAHTVKALAAVEATCTSTGLTAGEICEVCNTVLKAQEVVAVKAHTEKVLAAVDATCTATGLTEGKICEVCNTLLVAQEVVAVKAHTPKALAAVEATCTGTGLTAGEICEVCNTILTAQTVVAAKGHTEVEDAAVAATCTTAGLTAGKHCSVCNVITVAQEVVNAEGHKFGDWSVTVEATKKAAGEKERVCSVCTEKETVEIPQLPANTGMIVIIIVLAVLALGGIGATIFFAVKKK